VCLEHSLLLCLNLNFWLSKSLSFRFGCFWKFWEPWL
jgi:hypothetical protein